MNQENEIMELKEMIIEVRDMVANVAVVLEDTKKQLEDKIDELDSRMNQGFARVDQRLDHHETWLKRIDQKLDAKAEKKDFAYLVKVLERKEVISLPEASHLRYSGRSA